MSEPPTHPPIHPPIHTGVDEVAAHPRHTGRPWLDMVLALSAVTISVISLFVAIGHGRTEEKLVAASSWPFVVADTSIDDVVGGKGTFTLFVANRGVGPARIKSARLLLDGHPIRHHQELLAACCGYAGGDMEAQLRQGLINANTIVGVLTPRDVVDVLTVQRLPQFVANWTRFTQIGPRLRLSACYCSVLDECWTTDLRSIADPQRVATCTSGPDDYVDCCGERTRNPAAE